MRQRVRGPDTGECEQSYNSFYAPPAAQQAVAINTYLALLGSSIAGLSASAIFNGNLKLNIFDAQRSSVAGELDASLSKSKTTALTTDVPLTPSSRPSLLCLRWCGDWISRQPYC